MKKKKIGICSGSGTGSGSIIPEADRRIRIKMIRIRNTAYMNYYLLSIAFKKNNLLYFCFTMKTVTTQR